MEDTTGMEESTKKKSEDYNSEIPVNKKSSKKSEDYNSEIPVNKKSSNKQ